MHSNLEKQSPINRAQPSALLLSILLILYAPLAFAATDLPEKVAAELATLDKARDEAVKEARKPTTDLDKNYLAALATARTTAQEAGKLEKLLAVDEEINRVKSGLKDGNTPQDAEVAQLRKSYIETISQRDLAVTVKIAEIDRQHAAGIDKIVTELTKTGMIDEAKLVLEIKNSNVGGETKTADMVTPPKEAPKSIVGTTWKLQGRKDFSITFMEDGTFGRPLHTYEMAGKNKVQISWGKLDGRVERKDYQFDDGLTELTGIQDHSQWKRVAPERYRADLGTPEENKKETPANKPIPEVEVSNTNPLDLLAQEGSNMIAWVTSPLDVDIPANFRANISLLREDLLDGHAKGSASPEIYQSAVELCDNLMACIDKKEKQQIDANLRFAQAKQRSPLSNQALEARRNYLMSWPQYSREVRQREVLAEEKADNTDVKASELELSWIETAGKLRKSLDVKYSAYRAALRKK